MAMLVAHESYADVDLHVESNINEKEIDST